MRQMKTMLAIAAATTLAALAPLTALAQGNIHERSTQYEWPKDEQVVNNLKQWQDLKFGVLIHWGLYAVPGIVESWSICDEEWITRDSTCTYQEYMDWYFGLADEFRPTKFDASQWAAACADAGMRYMIFTTKHHDGFCMFDSRETDFSIAHHAFRDDPRRDVLKYVLDAFRDKNFTVGTYFSKPDWHSQLYWWDTYGKKGRNVNYPVQQHPQRWQRFVKYTHNQIEELMTRYGKVDILWLDGGWVAAGNRGQDIDMPGMAQMARSHQPGLIIVDARAHHSGRAAHVPVGELHSAERRLGIREPSALEVAAAGHQHTGGDRGEGWQPGVGRRSHARRTHPARGRQPTEGDWPVAEAERPRHLWHDDHPELPRWKHLVHGSEGRQQPLCHLSAR